MSVKVQAVNSIKWQISSNIIQKIISFGGTLILARHLGPSVFGLFAFSLIVVSSFDLFKSLGIDSALIRRQADFDRAASTAFWLIPIFGITLYIFLCVSAPYIGKLLNNNEIVPIVRWLGLIFTISCFVKVPVINLERKLEFKLISTADVCATLAFTGFAISLTYLGFGIWSLVFAYIFKILVYSLLIFRFSKYKMRWDFDWKLAKEMFHFGKFIFLGAALWFLRANLDNVLVGKVLGVTMLGYYAVAFNISNFLSDYFSNRIARVLYPAYSKLQDDLDGLRAATLKTFKYLCLIVLPFGIGVFFFGENFLKIAYGEKWIGAIPVLKILILAGVFNALPAGFNAVFLACNKPRLGFKITLLQVILFFIFIVPLAKMFGLNGAGIVVSLSSLVAFIISITYVMKLLHISLSMILFNIKSVLIASLLMFFSSLYLNSDKSFLFLIESKYILFVFQILCPLGIYSFCMLILDEPIIKEIKTLLNPGLRKQKSNNPKVCV